MLKGNLFNTFYSKDIELIYVLRVFKRSRKSVKFEYEEALNQKQGAHGRGLVFISGRITQ